MIGWVGELNLNEFRLSENLLGRDRLKLKELEYSRILRMRGYEESLLRRKEGIRFIDS